MKKKKIKLGRCPHCNSGDYECSDTDFINRDGKPFIRVPCVCSKCEKEFVEYFGLDEVYFNDDVEGLYTNLLCNEDKETIKGWAELELDMKEEQFTNKEHYEDYINRVKRIIKLMKGESIDNS